MPKADERGSARADLLLDYAILDTPNEQAFDDIVFLAAQICAAPIALVSLLDHDRQWFKARIGLAVAETPIDQSVCRIGIDGAALLVIPDLTADPRTSGNPLVTEAPHLRFYAGAPLVSDSGVAIGRLCVIDVVPRPDGLTDVQRKMLGALARQVMTQLEQDRSNRLASQLALLQSCLVDVGECIRQSISIADMTYRTAEIVGNVLGASRAGYGAVDATTEAVTIEPDWTAPGIASIAGTHRFADFGRIRDELASGEPLVIDDVSTDPRTAPDPSAMRALDIGALINMPVRENGSTIAVFIVQSRAARHWTAAELAFLRSVADRLEAGVARYKAERQQDTLNREISHRLKNTLAMVQAIATQTLRGVTERAPIEAFERRLMALSSAHDVLMRQNWEAAGLADVLDGVLRTFGYETRISWHGSPVSLGARAALSLSLLAHELMTNAIKYGALSNETGKVSVQWHIDERDRCLRLLWRETGGPPVVAPSRRGFGSRLIQTGLMGTGEVDLRYNPLGLEVEMVASVDDLSLS